MVNHRVIRIAKSGGVTILLLIGRSSLLWCWLPSAYRVLSLDHLIRSCQHARRNCQSDLLGCFQIDHQLDLRRLLHGQIGRLGTFQDLAHINSRAPVGFELVGPIGRQ